MQTYLVPPPPPPPDNNGSGDVSVELTERPPLPEDASSDWSENAVKLEADLIKHYYSLRQKDFDNRSLAALELGRYLERVLWPGFKHLVRQFTKGHSDTSSTSMELKRSDSSEGETCNENTTNGDGQSFRVGGITKEHMLFLVLMINEKGRQRVNPWQMLDSNEDTMSTKDSSTEATESFSDLFYRIAAMSHVALETDLTLSERSLLVVFFVQCFQSLERQEICNICLRFCGLPMLYHLTQKQRSAVLQREPMFKKGWRKLEKLYNDTVRDSSAVTRTYLHRDFLAGHIDKFLEFVVSDFRKIVSTEVIQTSEVIVSGQADDHGEINDATPSDEKTHIRAVDSEMASNLRFNAKNSPKQKLLADALLYTERMLEWMIDLMSQLPTRRMLKPVIRTLQVVARCKHSDVAVHSEGGLFLQLVEMLDFYEHFEIDDFSGETLNHEALEDVHYHSIHQLQKTCFAMWRETDEQIKAATKRESQDNPTALADLAADLKSIWTSSVGHVDSVEALETALSKLPTECLRALNSRLEVIDGDAVLSHVEAMHDGRRSAEEMLAASKSDDKSIAAEKNELESEFMIKVLSHHFSRRQSQLQRINSAPLFPTENLIWDPNFIPAEHFKGEFPLALPKLNLQFLTVHDYLLRNFTLFRLESTYEIRENLEDAIYRMDASRMPNGGTNFRGKWKMATPLTAFSVLSVGEPKLGETCPRSVRAEVLITLAGMPAHERREWESMRQYETLFLVGIVAPMSLAGHSASSQVRPQDLSKVEDFPREFGVVSVRGCELTDIVDEEGNSMTDRNPAERFDPIGDARTLRVALDPQQYSLDMQVMTQGEGMDDLYGSFNLLVRRRPEENNFKAILQTIRTMMNNPESTIVPEWLHDIFLGYGDPKSAHFSKLSSKLRKIDFQDTFLDAEHLAEIFPLTTYLADKDSAAPRPAAEQFQLPCILNTADADFELPLGQWPVQAHSLTLPSRGPYPECKRRRNAIRFTPTQVECIVSGVNPGLTVVVGPPGTGKTDTAVQIINLLHHNFPEQKILIVAHSNLALNDLFEKIVCLDIEERYLLRLGMGERELRMQSDDVLGLTSVGRRDFSKWGRVNYMLQRRMDLLEKAELLASTLSVPGDVSSTCETATNFYKYHIVSRIAAYRTNVDKAGRDGLQTVAVIAEVKAKIANRPVPTADDFMADGVAPDAKFEEEDVDMNDPAARQRRKRQRKRMRQQQTQNSGAGGPRAAGEGADAVDTPMTDGGHLPATRFDRETLPELDDASLKELLDSGETVVSILFPFKKFFKDAPQPLFPPGAGVDAHHEIAESCYRYLEYIFNEIAECQAFELLRNMHDRATFLVTRHAKIIAMTCTHAALTRQQLVDLNFKYDTLIMEESAQILEVETFIPMLLQQAEKQTSRLKRVVLIGDHHQLPPVVKNQAFQQYGNLDQSLFRRFVRLGTPHLVLDKQGRARPTIASLYNWRYKSLGNLPVVEQREEYCTANAGLAFDYQFINVEDYEGRGESAPLPFFYQNRGEAETAVALFMYLRLLGHPAGRISILSSYNGQRQLLKEIVDKRCGWNPAVGWPARITTIDRYQGQQNDIVIISLVRTATVGHIRDVRRLIVAVSRARLGLYIIGRQSLFAKCFELRPVLSQMLKRPTKLALHPNEQHPTQRAASDVGTPVLAQDVYHMWEIVQTRAAKVLKELQGQSSV